MGKPDLLTAVDAIYASALDPGALAGSSGPHRTTLVRRARRGDRANLTVRPDGDHCAPPAWTRATQDYNREWWRYDIRNERRSARGITDGLITDAIPPG